ncbi:hypothetical protein JW905_05380 [bacterium]|nr:hypothetical protein [candidate division CSSED10-310 bacterium]
MKRSSRINETGGEGHQEDQAAALRKLALELSLAEARARRRIAEDLHDHLGQYLAVIKMKLSTFQGNTMFCGHEQDLVEIQHLLDKAIHFTRHLTMAVSPPILYELGLVPALQWLADQYRRQHGLSIELIVSQPLRPIEEDIRGILYRSVRELLINVVKHAEASHVELGIEMADQVVITLMDDGRGFSPESVRGDNEFGLFSIRERMNYLGGGLEVSSHPGAGTRVVMRCPVRQGETP